MNKAKDIEYYDISIISLIPVYLNSYIDLRA